MAIIKEIKEYERKKGTGVYNYRINISKQDNLEKTVAILSISEFENLKNLESAEKQKAVGILNKKVADQEKKIKDLENEKSDSDDLKQKLKSKDNEIL